MGANQCNLGLMNVTHIHVTNEALPCSINLDVFQKKFTKYRFIKSMLKPLILVVSLSNRPEIKEFDLYTVTSHDIEYNYIILYIPQKCLLS